MSKFLFEADAVLALLNHAKAAPQTVSLYGLTPNPGPGLMLVKDDGVYLMSNGEPPLPGTDTVNKVVYARGYEALPDTVSIEERMERYDKIRDAAGEMTLLNCCLRRASQVSHLAEWWRSD